MSALEKQRADVIIFSGQSNMQGQTEALPLENDPVENAFEYRHLTGELAELKHPCGEDIGDGLLLGAHLGRGSLLPAFCREYAARTGRTTVAVHAAKGATCAFEWLEGTARFEALVEKSRGALSKAAERFGAGRILFVWLQGESDALASTGRDDYAAQLRQLERSLKRELRIDGFMVIRVGRYVRDERDDEIIKAQLALCGEEGFVMLSEASEWLFEDKKYMNPEAGGHFGNAGMDLLGRESGRAAARHALAVLP